MGKKSKKIKVGVLGGSFNPVHLGHLIAAEEVLRKNACDEVWFMPCYKHAIKSEKDLAKPVHRVQMLAKALPKDSRYVVSTFEIERGDLENKTSYTIDTLKALKKNYPNYEFFWIMGSNLSHEFHKWKQASDLVKEIKIIIIAIPGFDVKKFVTRSLFGKNKPIVLETSVVMTNISSSLIRELIKAQKSIHFLVPEKVREYIEENKLYR
ncbi:MAG: nicotinate-nucleotide adenylyltransferase [Candidatus Diapherotrites archaeon]|nr:nicotinate-nucleotide adenylyltransferase [Candidatus Diapherotrites archaeon]